MSKRIVFLGAAAAALWAAVPAAAADYPSGDDGVPAFHCRDEGDGVDFGRSGGHRRAPGPVVFDERGSDRRFDRPAPGYDGPGDRRPVALGRPAWGYGYGRPAFAGPGGGRADGWGPPDGFPDGGRPVPFYRPVAVPAGPAFGDGVGCTVEQVQSETPSGWRETVTHRTCYRR
ncbi:hypothetical protein D3273_13770 [Lichenibacterium minor]|uniref:Uncharacterized protein n=1 Tax=Lichenibacterium minor TaxID=2316528 RepID=A0A4Q2U973_9HYPH|nr:hypothetical protein [Lichenibacterium minor]RYC31445.1 hypothetical protein D3273_13770 [Lichenibacterium minor]